MPPPQRNDLGTHSPRPDPVPEEPFTTLETSGGSSSKRWERKVARIRLVPGRIPPCSLFQALVLLVFVSCVVPLSTPSSTQQSTPFGNGSSSFPNINSTLASSEGEEPVICPTAKTWIQENGSFCFVLRDSPFLRNLTELRAREERAVDMFCELESILDKVDCAQPYSVNRRQCKLCREAYRDWACAMTADTLEDGRVDCEGGVMPCPSCASICHQVMRLCPYLTPDRVQFDELGGPTAHVSQYGGHPAFYCPLENIHASDPAYSSDCSKSQMMSSNDPDYVHNLCAADARFMSKRSAALDMRDVQFYIPHYSSCCWTYASSLVEDSAVFENIVKEHGTGYYNNRVILNCCDEAGNCDSSDPVGSGYNSSSYTNSSLYSSWNLTLGGGGRSSSSGERAFVGSSLRTANNQVRGEDGRFRELSSAYMHDEGMDDEEDDDEEYYEDSSAGSEVYSSSGGSSNERPYVRKNRFYMEESSSSVISIHRDNKIYSTRRESRSVHDIIYIEHEGSASGVSSACSITLARCVGNLVGMVISVMIPPIVCLLVTCSCPSSVCVCSFVIGEVVEVAFLRPWMRVTVIAFRLVLVLPGAGVGMSVRKRRPVHTRSSSRTVVPHTTIGYLVVDNKLIVPKTLFTSICCSRQRCSCCEYLRFVSNYSNLITMMMNLPINNIINLRLSHRKLVVNQSINASTRVLVIRRRRVGRVITYGMVTIMHT